MLQSTNVVVFGLDSFDAVIKTLVKARTSLGEVLSAFEFMDDAALNFAVTHGATYPMEQRHPFYALVETSGSNDDHDKEAKSDTDSHLCTCHFRASAQARRTPSQAGWVF